MVYYITVLRALAACLITNAHYEGIYPSDIIANGGLIGDVLFFAISGFCLYNIKNQLSPKGFASWYGKRLWRIAPPIWIITIVYMLLGFYKIDGKNGLFWWYFYPTYYHFVASIIVLYIPYFFIIKIDACRKHIPLLMSIIGVVWLFVYLFAYDKSYYHIDTVREPMIRFLFLESMLLGAWFRQNDDLIRNKRKWWDWPLTVVLLIAYFGSKLLFSRRPSLSSFQFINQLAIFMLLYSIFKAFSGIDKSLECLPAWLKSTVSFISKITLEIYAVQYVIIDVVRERGFAFPLNWICITAAILVAAFILHLLCKGIYCTTDHIILQLRREKQ